MLHTPFVVRSVLGETVPVQITLSEGDADVLINLKTEGTHALRRCWQELTHHGSPTTCS